MIFPELELGWNIAIIVSISIVSLYLLLFITNLIFIGSFSSMMRRDNRGIRVSMSAKLDILKKFQDVFSEKKIKLSEETLHSLKYLDTEDFLQAQKEEFELAREELTSCESEIKRLIDENNKLIKIEEIDLLLSLLKDINESLKTLTMAYNADVLGYNYWVKFPPCRFLLFLFRYKQKKTI